MGWKQARCKDGTRAGEEPFRHYSDTCLATILTIWSDIRKTWIISNAWV